jgi:2'-5' RNA ligase
VAAEQQRLFFALWPDAALRERLQASAAALDRRGGKPVPADNLHITLAFLGSVDAATRDCLVRGADDVRVAPFELVLDRSGHWPRPQVLWLGCGEEPAGILALASALKRVQLGCDLEPEARPFHAHLTVARKVRRGRAETLEPPLIWRVADFVLVASETRPEGAVYRVLKRWPLVP